MYQEGYLKNENSKDHVSFLRVQQYSQKRNHFVQVQIIKISPEESNLNLTKTIWRVQNHFGRIKESFEISKPNMCIQNDSVF